MKDADQNAEKEYNLIRMLAVTWTKSDLHGLGHFNLDPSSGSLLLFLFPSGFFDVVEMCMSCSRYKKTLQNREQNGLSFSQGLCISILFRLSL